MDDRKRVFGQAPEVNMEELVWLLWRKKWLIILSAILCTAVTFLVTKYCVTPKYQASVLFYVNNSSVTAEGSSVSLSLDSIRASQQLIDTYTVILNTRKTLDAVIEQAGIDAEESELRDGLEIAQYLTTETVENTELFHVYVTWPDVEETQRIATAIGEVLPGRIGEIIDASSARIVDYAVLPTEPFSPIMRNNLILGAMLGIVMSAGWMIIKQLYDTSIKSMNDLMQYSEYPILAVIPDLSEENE